MHQIRALFLLFLYAIQSASLVPSNTPRSNANYPGTAQVLQLANLIQPQNQSGSLTLGTYYDIGSNLTVCIILGDTGPAQSLYELLLLAKEQVHDRAALFGSKTTVPRRKKSRDLTQTTNAGLVYFIEPARAFYPSRPGLEWGEFEVLTFWLYEHLLVPLIYRNFSFVLFSRVNVTTGQEVNLAFGAIKPLNATMPLSNASSDDARLPVRALSKNNIDNVT